MVGRTRWLPALLLGAIGLIGVLGFARRAPMTQSESQILVGRPECPHDWDFKSQQMPTVGKNIDVPEFNDCQRFIMVGRGGQRRYAALFAIFAADTLRTMDSIETGTWVAVAEIYAEGVYGYLGIRGTYSCLFLSRTLGHAPEAFEARMLQVRNAEVDCDEVSDSARNGRRLKVNAETAEGFRWNDYPPVARWDWSEQTHKQYIGVKCGAAWCEVGDQDLPRSASAPAGVHRTRAIKGWYDEQFLAVQDPATDSLQPGRFIWGTIYPDSGLDGLQSIVDFQGQWRRVAYVALDTSQGVRPIAIQQYKNIMNLEVTQRGAAFNPGGHLNTIDLCHGNILSTSNPCSMPQGDSLRLATTCPGGGLWWSRVTSVGGQVRYFCVTRRDHSLEASTTGFRIPGTARWRWMANDEKAWTACLEGCCETGAS